jgi:hypothetical protein
MSSQEWPNTNRSFGSRRSTETDGREVPIADLTSSSDDSGDKVIQGLRSHIEEIWHCNPFHDAS